MNEEMQFDFRKFQLPNISLRTIRWMIIGIIIVIFLLSTIFTVNPEEVGVIQRFGKFTRVVSPGLNFKLPFGIETVKKVPVERQLKEKFGFRTRIPAVRTEYMSRPFQEESLMLPGDLNATKSSGSSNSGFQIPTNSYLRFATRY